jgi:hypothetical protein
MYPSQYDKLDRAVIMWFKQVRSQNIPVSRQLLKEYAMKLAEEHSLDNFQASNGWLEKFAQRHSISFKAIHGEAGAICMEKLGNWQMQILRDSLKEYSSNDIFNIDETGLFWQLLPNKTWRSKASAAPLARRARSESQSSSALT